MLRRQVSTANDEFGSFVMGRALRSIAIGLAGVSISTGAAAQPDGPAPSSEARTNYLMSPDAVLKQLDVNATPIIPSTKVGEYRFQELGKSGTPVVYRTVNVYGTNLPDRFVADAIWAAETEVRMGKKTILLEPSVEHGITYVSVRSWIAEPLPYMAAPLNALIPGATVSMQAQGTAKAVERWPIITAYLELLDSRNNTRVAIVGGGALRDQQCATFNFALTDEQYRTLQGLEENNRLKLRYWVISRLEGGIESRVFRTIDQSFVQKLLDEVRSENSDVRINGKPTMHITMEQVNRIARSLELSSNSRVDVGDPTSAEFASRVMLAPGLIQTTLRDQQSVPVESLAPKALENILERAKPLIDEILTSHEKLDTKTTTNEKSHTVTWEGSASLGIGSGGMSFGLSGGVSVTDQKLKRIVDVTGTRWKQDAVTRRYVPSEVEFYSTSSGEIATRMNEQIVAKMVEQDRNAKITDVSQSWTVDKLGNICESYAQGVTYQHRFNEQIATNQSQAEKIASLEKAIDDLKKAMKKADADLSKSGAAADKKLDSTLERLRDAVRFMAKADFNAQPCSTYSLLGQPGRSFCYGDLETFGKSRDPRAKRCMDEWEKAFKAYLTKHFGDVGF